MNTFWQIVAQISVVVFASVGLAMLSAVLTIRVTFWHMKKVKESLTEIRAKVPRLQSQTSEFRDTVRMISEEQKRLEDELEKHKAAVTAAENRGDEDEKRRLMKAFLAREEEFRNRRSALERRFGDADLQESGLDALLAEMDSKMAKVGRMMSRVRRLGKAVEWIGNLDPRSSRGGGAA